MFQPDSPWNAVCQAFLSVLVCSPTHCLNSIQVNLESYCLHFWTAHHMLLSSLHFQSAIESTELLSQEASFWANRYDISVQESKLHITNVFFSLTHLWWYLPFVPKQDGNICQDITGDEKGGELWEMRSSQRWSWWCRGRAGCNLHLAHLGGGGGVEEEETISSLQKSAPSQAAESVNYHIKMDPLIL